MNAFLVYEIKSSAEDYDEGSYVEYSMRIYGVFDNYEEAEKWISNYKIKVLRLNYNLKILAIPANPTTIEIVNLSLPISSYEDYVGGGAVKFSSLPQNLSIVKNRHLKDGGDY